jgi:hypothetical protein
MNIVNIESQIKQLKSIIEEAEQKLKKYIEAENVIRDFNIRYKAVINDSDGIFGLFPDEIILHIMSYLNAKDLLRPSCRRFYILREEFLRSRKYDMSDIVINKYISELFIFPIVFHVAKESGRIINGIYTQKGSDDDDIYLPTCRYSADVEQSTHIQYQRGYDTGKIAVINSNTDITICTKHYVIIISKSNFTHTIYNKDGTGIVERPGIFGMRDNLMGPKMDDDKFRNIFTNAIK